MKRPTECLFARQKRIAAYRLHERCKRAGLRQKKTESRYVRPGEIIKAPEAFNLTLGQGIQVVKFLRAVSDRVLRQGKQVQLDFRRTRMFYVPATILLFAELDRVVSSATIHKPITLLQPTERRPREVLKQIGLFNLTQDRCDTVPERSDVVYWKATKGSLQSGDQFAMLEAVAETVNKQHKEQLQISGLWRGVSEAVANTVDHAYLRPRSDGFEGLPDTKWWMFTQLKDGHFTAAVCDLGCGYASTIDSTLPEQFLTTIRATLKGISRDSQAVQAAMEYGRSGTRESNRGKGSRDALSLLENHGNGELVVLSGSGGMRYEYRNGGELSRAEIDLAIDIRGTIVWWKLPLNGE
ncbi:hypothetical protein [Piscinibacterium candidicorallinum]|uniref:ATP-binding protein n=1 Tax=Piscinibacterium candidicorallinum TaxID=1793872 RepID=A0ABV7HA93_9BURK